VPKHQAKFDMRITNNLLALGRTDDTPVLFFVNLQSFLYRPINSVVNPSAEPTSSSLLCLQLLLCLWPFLPSEQVY